VFRLNVRRFRPLAGKDFARESIIEQAPGKPRFATAQGKSPMMKLIRFPVFLLIALAASLALMCSAADRPNIVWILSEDNSKHYLKLFNEMGAPAPNIEKLASKGLVFDHAFSCSSVCSVARTTLITSIYAPRAGTQFHRKRKMAQLPDGWQMFAAYFRDAGYYTTNNSKKDYNAIEGKGVCDESL